jgi:hypothetical protein
MRWGFGLGLAACFCLGCPGAEPSATGSGGAGSGGAPSGTSSSSSGEGAGGGSVSSSSGTGGMNEGGCDSGELGDEKNCGACGRGCDKEGAVAAPKCVEGRCTSECDSGFVNITRPLAPAPDDGCERQGRRVFVTEMLYAVEDFGSVEGADDTCQALADGRDLGGTWRAWISDSQSAVAERFTYEPLAPYLLLDGQPVAASWEALTSTGDQSSLDRPIDLTETGASAQALTNTAVWTGTRPNGFASESNCGDWAPDNQTAQGTTGDCSLSSSGWTVGASPRGCAGSEARLYCFEQ